MTLLNYFITGWYNPFLDKYYMNSWQGKLVIWSIPQANRYRELGPRLTA